MSTKRNSVTIGYMSIGHHSRVSDWIMTEEQSRHVDLAIQELKDALDRIFPDWTTANIEVKEENED